MSKFDEFDGFNELHGYWLEDLKVGQSVITSRTITEAAIELFGAVSGDINPTHFSDDFASKERFGKRIVHGFLTISHITGAFGTKLPGPGSLYMRQNVKFLAPVYIGDTVTTRIEVKDIDYEKERVSFKTDQFVGDTQVVDGDAMFKVPSKQK